MKRACLLLIALALALAGCAAGCGESTEDVWGGYTEGEAKDLLKDDEFRMEIFRTAPADPRGPIDQLYPTNEQIDDADLAKATIQGEEYWEYRNEEDDWCIFVAKDPETKSFIAQVGCAFAD